MESGGGDAANVEERLERLEAMLRDALERLERLEALLSALGEEAAVATRLAIAFSLPALRAVEAARRVLSLGAASYDPLSRSIVEALADCEPRGVSEITRMVRALRGSASKRIVRERLERLVEDGVVVVEERGQRKYYRLSSCPGGGESREPSGVAGGSSQPSLG